MRELLALQERVSDVDARIAVDHAIFHLDADLRWLDAAEERVVAERSRPSAEGGR
jgi:hypothetical protein